MGRALGGRSDELWLTGRTNPPRAPRPLQAGPLDLDLIDGDIRRVRCGKVELAQRIYVAVRDLNWDTVPGVLDQVQVRSRRDSFDVSYRSRHLVGGDEYCWSAEIRGESDGSITFALHAPPIHGWPLVKVGICVHHPVPGFAGMPFAATRPDGGTVRGQLPVDVAQQRLGADGSETPHIEPFRHLQLRHTAGPVAEFDFRGGAWVLEDQRNWTDSSFKSTWTSAEGDNLTEAVEQEVVLTGDWTAPPRSVSTRPHTHILRVGAADGRRMPPVGLVCSDPAAALATDALKVLAAVGPRHLRWELRLGDERPEDTSETIDQLATMLGCPLELAIFVPSHPTGQASRQLDRLLGTIQGPIVRTIALSEGQDCSSAADVALVRAALQRSGHSDTPTYGGTNGYFNELNRHRDRQLGADGLAWSVTPQIHAFDDLSLMENLAAQSDTVTTAQAFAPAALLAVGPVTLRPRTNLDATSPTQWTPRELPWPVDHRQATAFAAAWTLGSISAMARAGVDSLTYYDCAGPTGVVLRPEDEISSFPVAAGQAFPLAAVLADLCAMADAELLTVDMEGEGSCLTAIAVQRDGGAELLLGNLTREQINAEIVWSSSRRREAVSIKPYAVTQVRTSEAAA